MCKFEVEFALHKALQKLFKKDKKRYEIVWNKIKEIINSENVEHYKNLRRPLNDFKRVHIDKSFVLIFKYDSDKDKVIFYDFDHHDKIYFRKY